MMYLLLFCHPEQRSCFICCPPGSCLTHVERQKAMIAPRHAKGGWPCARNINKCGGIRPGKCYKLFRCGRNIDSFHFAINIEDFFSPFLKHFIEAFLGHGPY